MFDQGAKLVQNAVDDGSMFKSQAWHECTQRVRESGEPLHFIGLLSDGNVHSHIGHLEAMLRRADTDGVAAARVHVLLDGRDVHETSSLLYVERLESLLAQLRDKSTRPAEFRGWKVPEVLLSGDHGRIDEWRRQQEAESNPHKLMG